jgi:hypothetical protein
VPQRSGLDTGGTETETVIQRESGRERNKGYSQTLLSQDPFTERSCDSNICFRKISSLKDFFEENRIISISSLSFINNEM